ncbi:MAG: phage tail assembly chaperone [Terricaulis sp.]
MICAALQKGVAPAAFWRLSLREWRSLTRSEAGAAIERATFEALAARFPDART